MIPVCEPLIGDSEKGNVLECLDTNWISSAGRFVSEFEKRFPRECCDVEYGVAVCNGTTAIHLAVAALGLGVGDEVICPSFTMIASANPIVYAGARPVFVDAEEETWNMDVSKIEQHITDRTKAIMVVHIYGHPCDMDPIMELAEKHNLKIIEDAAEAHGAEYRKKRVGGLGDIAAFSFYANKIITTGEGGMVVTDDKELADRAQLLKNLAFLREKRFLHRDLGFNYRMTNIQAAIGCAQLDRLDEFVEIKRKNAALYSSLLAKVPGVTTPAEKKWAKNVYWMYSILIDPSEFGMSRDDLTKKLRDAGVDSRDFFVPMHKQPIYEKLGFTDDIRRPVSEMLGDRGLYLPSGLGLTEEQIHTVCQTVKKIQSGRLNLG